MVTVKNLMNSPVDIQAIKGVIRVPAFGEASGEFNPATLDMFKTAGWVDVVSGVVQAAKKKTRAKGGKPSDEIIALRREYKKLAGKAAANEWSLEELTAKVEEFKSDKGAGESGTDTSSTPSAKSIANLRAEYNELIGKKPFNGWDEAELQKRIDAALES